MLDGKQSDFSDEDKGRRNSIANLLQEWNLVKIVHNERFEEPLAPMSHIKILPHKEKSEWILESKYSIGKRKNNAKVAET